MRAQEEAYIQTVRLPTADYLPASRHMCLSQRAHRTTDSTQQPIQTAQVAKGDQGQSQHTLAEQQSQLQAIHILRFINMLTLSMCATAPTRHREFLNAEQGEWCTLRMRKI